MTAEGFRESEKFGVGLAARGRFAGGAGAGVYAGERTGATGCERSVVVAMPIPRF